MSKFAVVCFLWRPEQTGDKVPRVVTYGAGHVNTLYRMVQRHLHMDHEFVCVTDMPEGIDPGVRIVPLWNKCRHMGGWWNRLYVFAPEMREIIAPRFVCIDLDVVITGDITPLFDRSEDFIINKYHCLNPAVDPDQYLNGGMFMMDAGARREVWDTFGEHAPAIVARHPRMCIGGDQAWMRLVLGKREVRWTEADGVHEALVVRDKLPPGARMVFFAGRRDPTVRPAAWVREHYR